MTVLQVAIYKVRPPTDAERWAGMVIERMVYGDKGRG